MIKLTGIAKEYSIGGEVFCALKNINLVIEKGEFSALIGPSGSGKSTLMHIIGLLDRPTKGQMIIKGVDISKLNDDKISRLRNEYVGFVFQQFNLINKLNVLENIIMPAMYARKKLTYDPKEKAYDLIKKFGLQGREYAFPNKISGGQQQRVAIARSLIMEPELVLADEPTGNLDTATGDDILDLLQQLNNQMKITVLLVTHEPDVAKKARRIIKIRDGQIV